MSDYDYLLTQKDSGVLKNLSEMGEHLEQLQVAMLAAEDQYKAAKGEFEHYRDNVLPMAMYNAGVSSLSLLSGNKIEVKTSYHCTPNKNSEDQLKLMEWLRSVGGEHLINSEAIVPGEAIEELRKDNIPFIAQEAVNSNSLKSFIKGLIGATTGTAQLDITDIPSFVHFEQKNSVEISVKKVR